MGFTMQRIISILLLTICVPLWASETEWVEVSASDRSAVECPDVLRFESKQRYKLFNDCYAIDPKSPLLEGGTYTQDNGEIHFFRQVIMGEYSILSEIAGMKNRVSVQVETKPGQSLVIRAGGKEFHFAPAH